MSEITMEVKDVNNQNNPLALIKKNNSPISALDFSSLIAAKKDTETKWIRLKLQQALNNGPAIIQIF